MPHKDPEARKAYARQRYLDRAEELKAYARQQRIDKREEISKQRRAKYASRSPERRQEMLDYQRQWHDEHPEAGREYGRRRRAEHPEDKDYLLRWYAEHPEAVARYGVARRAQAVQGMTEQDFADTAEWRKLIADDPCFYCGIADAETYEDDHYVPIAKGGTSHWWNLVRACQQCNRAKSTTHGDVFLEVHRNRQVQPA